MNNDLKEQLNEIKKLKGNEREEKLLLFAEENNSPQAYNELGIYYKDVKKDNEKAAEMLQKALSFQKDATIYSNLATCYYNLSVPDTPQREMYMKKTVEAFEASAKLNSASWFFLGNLYMPKVNAPFPEDYEKAVSCFMNIEKDKGYFWANGMKNIGMYYYHQKKDFYLASAFLYLAKTGDPKDKKAANYYEYAFGKIPNRKFWTEQMKKINDQRDVERVIQDGKRQIVRRCPKCGSVDCQRISAMKQMRKMLRGAVGFKRYKEFQAQFQCNSCHHEW